QFKINRNNERLDRLVADVDLRLRALEKGQGVRSISAPSSELRSPANAAQQEAQSSASGTAVISSGVANEVAQPGQQAFGVISKRDLNQYKTSGTVTPASANPPTLLRGTSDQRPVRAAAVSKPVAAPAPAPVTAATAQTASVDAGVLPDGTPEEQYKHAHGLMMKRKMSEA
ncbi:MAG: hypothetical protein VX107_10600, partial [Pseudomonadota bacterium]|nr:hypothetical protein [Pseudomonadota bacterium]